MNRAMEEYLSNLGNRDRREKAHAAMIDQYSRLADRATQAESKLRALETASGDSASADLVSHLQTELATARADLSTVQTNNATSTTKISTLTTELEATKQELVSTTSQKNMLAKQAGLLDRRLKDRNAEARESRKLVEQVQDEMIGLNLEKNVAEQRAEQLERENKELVDRFMEYKKKEAEWMNEESKW